LAFKAESDMRTANEWNGYVFRGFLHLMRPLEPGEPLPRLPGLLEQLVAYGEDLSRAGLAALADEIEVSELEFAELGA
jgi:hypothetical protein